MEQILRSQFNYLKVEDGDYVPIFERKEKVKRKKIYKQCKFFGHHIPCPFKEFTGHCQHVHDVQTREAWDYRQRQK